MKKFHIVSSLVNFALIVFVMCSYLIIRALMDKMYGHLVPSALFDLNAYMLIFFSWASTFIIYKVSNIKYHFLLFLI
jgi:hypothetical protein